MDTNNQVVQNSGIAYEGYYSEFYNERTWEQYTFLLTTVVSNSKPGVILDLGAGLGFFIEAATNWGFKCLGLEGSEEAVKLAKERNIKLNINHHLLSNELPYESKSIQTILINQVIEHLEPDVAKMAVTESFRVLNSGGMIYITSPCKYDKFQVEDDPTHINMYTPSELETLVKSAGFIKVKPMNYNLSFLGKSYIASKIAGIIFRYTKWDRISATANLIAFKP